MTSRPPAPRPCPSCPYLRAVPSGVWHATEYQRLRRYDLPTHQQPPGVFLCHQSERDDPRARVCAGWAGCHVNNPAGYELLALRAAVALGTLTEADRDALWTYATDAPLFATAAEAAEHGLTDFGRPGPAARALLAKIGRRRTLHE